MVRRYAHLSSTHLAEYVDRMAQYRAADTPPRSYDPATRLKPRFPISAPLLMEAITASD